MLIGSTLLTAFASVANHILVHGAHSWVVDSTESGDTSVVIDALHLDLHDRHLLNFLGCEQPELDFPHFV